MTVFLLLLVGGVVASTTKSPTTRSPTTYSPTRSPTGPTTLSPTQAPSTHNPTSSPTTHTPTVSPAPTPVLVPPSNALCGVWSSLQKGKCAAAQSCCQANASGVCTVPLTASVNTFITQEDFQFAIDGGYSIQFMVGTGVCPLGLDNGTLITVIVSLGSYENIGNNTALGSDWQKLIYNAETFQATLTKTNKAVFYTPGDYTSGGELTGPCTDLDTLFRDPGQGCPCNGNWTVSPFVNGTSPATRYINKTACETNGTSTCPEEYYFRTAPKYGSFRVTYTSSVPNGTIDTRILEITRPSYDNVTGWNNTIVYASFTANFTCPTQVSQDNSTFAPTSGPTLSPTLSPTKIPTVATVSAACEMLPQLVSLGSLCLMIGM